MCISGAALIAAGTTSIGGIAALVATALRAKTQTPHDDPIDPNAATTTSTLHGGN